MGLLGQPASLVLRKCTDPEDVRWELTLRATERFGLGKTQAIFQVFGGPQTQGERHGIGQQPFLSPLLDRVLISRHLLTPAFEVLLVGLPRNRAPGTFKLTR